MKDVMVSFFLPKLWFALWTWNLTLNNTSFSWQISGPIDVWFFWITKRLNQCNRVRIKNSVSARKYFLIKCRPPWLVNEKHFSTFMPWNDLILFLLKSTLTIHQSLTISPLTISDVQPNPFIRTSHKTDTSVR